MPELLPFVNSMFYLSFTIAPIPATDPLNDL